MIVKLEDADATSYYDGVILVTRPTQEHLVRLTQFTGEKLIACDITYGIVSLLSDKGKQLEWFDLGPKIEPEPSTNPGMVPAG